MSGMVDGTRQESGASVVVRPRFSGQADRTLQTAASPFTATQIDHLDLALFRAGTTNAVASKVVRGPASGTNELTSTLTFTNLTVGANYTITAKAYKGPSPSQTADLISLDNAAARASFLVTDPSTIHVDLQVTLIDVVETAATQATYQGLVSTWAGSGATGFDNFVGTNASFDGPAGLALASDGTLYVSDSRNNAIRRIAADRTVTTLAGLAPGGNQDGAAAIASFRTPTGLTLAPDQHLYLTERDNHVIRKIDLTNPAAPVISLVAGQPQVIGDADGLPGAARFNHPGGLAVGTDGKIYVADTANHSIRVIDTLNGNMVSTLAGPGPGAGISAFADGPATTARFNNPTGLALDTHHHVYVADRGNFRIRVINTLLAPTDPAFVTTLAGTADEVFTDGNSANARFRGPASVALAPDGALLVTDVSFSGSLRVLLRRIELGGISTSDGFVSTLVGAGGIGDEDGLLADTQLGCCPANIGGVAVDQNGKVYMSDSFNQRIRRIQ